MLAAKIEYRNSEQRESARADLDQPSTVRDAARIPHDIVVTEFSQDGCRFDAKTAFDAGSAVCIGLDGAGVVEAVVVWRKGSVHGCRFDTRLEASRFISAFSTAPVISGRFAHSQPNTGTVNFELSRERPSRTMRVLAFVAAPVCGWAMVYLVGLALLG